MIIKCIKGGELELSKTKLTEITGYIAEPYYLNLKDLRKKEFWVRTVRNGNTRLPYAREENRPNTIGCRTFSPATFAKILKAAGVLKPKSRKPKSRKRSK